MSSFAIFEEGFGTVVGGFVCKVCVEICPCDKR